MDGDGDGDGDGELVNKLRDWLTAEDSEFFRNLKSRGVRLDDPALQSRALHIRKYLREITKFSWSPQDYDSRWLSLVEKAVEL